MTALGQALNPPKKKLGRPEEALQITFVSWFRIQFPHYSRLLFANLNALAFTGDKSEAGVRRFIWKLIRLKEMGLEKGVPDLTLAVRRGSYSGLYCEVKVPGKNPRSEQDEMIELLRGQGYYVCVCRTLEEFMNEVKRYMKLETVGRVANG